MGIVRPGEDEVEALVRRDYRRLVRAIALSCGSVQEAEDAMQEAVSKAWTRARSGYAFDHLEGWIVTVALNHTRRSWLRHGSRQDLRSALRATSGDVAESDRGAMLMDLSSAVDRLPRRQREVVVLHYYLGYPIADIARLLEIAPGSVKNALFKARGGLARALGDQEEVVE